VLRLLKWSCGWGRRCLFRACLIVALCSCFLLKSTQYALPNPYIFVLIAHCIFHSPSSLISSLISNLYSVLWSLTCISAALPGFITYEFDDHLQKMVVKPARIAVVGAGSSYPRHIWPIRNANMSLRPWRRGRIKESTRRGL
jgi:hypothetical protein